MAKSCGADLVVFGSECLKEKGDRLVPDYVSVPEIEGAFDFQGFWDNFPKEFKVVTAVWNRMFRREFLLENDIKSGNLSTGQDAVFLYDVYAGPLKSVAYNKGIYYKYIVHKRSATTSFKRERLDNIFKCTKRLEEMLASAEGARGRYGYLAEGEYVNSVSWGIRAMCGASDVSVFEVSRILREYMERDELKNAFKKLDYKKTKGLKRKIRLFL
ncbi:MAG: hypothetical protein LIO87_10060, partial [Eubacterium sp.]|nr:hypothetical protein [Eubacterium sp.]